MRNLKLFFAGLLLTVVNAAVLFAGTSSYIRIVDPEDGSSKYPYNIDDIAQVKYQFAGQVSSDCKAIRVLWSPGCDGHDAIDEYLIKGAKPIKGFTVDDFYLKKFKAGDSKFEYNASGAFENLAWGTNCYRFIAYFNDGHLKTTRLTLYVHQGGAAEMGKPVIYLYPQKKTKVKVNVKPEGKFTKTEPAIGKKGWSVTAYPDGRIVSGKSEYPYLFWESEDNSEPIDLSHGFVVASGDMEKFLDEKLTLLGLNKKEIADFMEFWLPKLTASPYEFITFYSKEMIDAKAPLSVSPAPDSVIRVYFDHKPLEKPIETEEQVLVPASRKGFAVVEWGGRNYK